MKLNFWEELEELRQTPIRLGVSSCLLGEEVRFDGGHKKNRFLVDELARIIHQTGN